jgi:hypothetical protein
VRRHDSVVGGDGWSQVWSATASRLFLSDEMMPICDKKDVRRAVDLLTNPKWTGSSPAVCSVVGQKKSVSGTRG